MFRVINAAGQIVRTSASAQDPGRNPMNESQRKPRYLVFSDLHQIPIGFGYRGESPSNDREVTLVIDEMPSDGKLFCVAVEEIRKPNKGA